jgi:hypothetical protein
MIRSEFGGAILVEVAIYLSPSSLIEKPKALKEAAVDALRK